MTGSPFESGYATAVWQVRDRDLAPVPTPCRNDDTVTLACPVRVGALLDGETLVGLDEEAPAGDEALIVAGIDDGTLQRFPLPDLGDDADPEVGRSWMEVDSHEGRALVSTALRRQDPFPTTLIVDVATGTVTEVPVAGTVRFLRAPIVRPAP